MRSTKLITPTDANNVPLQNAGSIGAVIAKTYDATISTATDIVLNAATTTIEVSAIDKGVFLKYGATASTSDFDEFIQAGQTKVFLVTGGSTISVIQQAASAAVVVIEK